MEDPELVREDLIRRLLEYERHKDAANEFEGRPLPGRDTFNGRGPSGSIRRIWSLPA